MTKHEVQRQLGESENCAIVDDRRVGVIPTTPE
jgi:hypothetical protein